jgi:hypothetical protein
MEYQLITPSIPYDKSKYNMVERVLINRGIKPQDIEHYLHTTDEDILPPGSIARIEDGVKMLLKHVR